jgi:hypothetical protein
MATPPPGLAFVQQKYVQSIKTAQIAFCGGTYTNAALASDGEECINLIPEKIEAGDKAGQLYLPKVPGLLPLLTFPTSPVIGVRDVNGRHFAIAGGIFYEWFLNGTYKSYGSVGFTAGPASMTDSGYQILMCSTWGSQACVFDLRSNILTPGISTLGNFSQVDFVDGFFIGLVLGQNEYQISNIFDATTWSALNYAQIAGTGDTRVGVKADHEQLWLFGNKNTEIWYNSGNANFPFQRVPQAILPMGLAAVASVVQLDNAVFWLGADERGQGIVYRTNGWVPQRVSNHAMEQQIQGYTKISDAYAYAVQDGGHAIYYITFPSAFAQTEVIANVKQTIYTGVTWGYDVSTGLWHKRLYWNPTVSAYQAHLGMCHCVAGGEHIYGDRASGNLYVASHSCYQDNGTALRWLRSTPHISNEERWTFFHAIQLYMQTATTEEIFLRYSNDGGFTWNARPMRGTGGAGQYKTRIKWNMLGRARNRCWEVSGAGNCPTAIVDAFLTFTPGVA